MFFLQATNSLQITSALHLVVCVLSKQNTTKEGICHRPTKQYFELILVAIEDQGQAIDLTSVEYFGHK